MTLCCVWSESDLWSGTVATKVICVSLGQMTLFLSKNKAIIMSHSYNKVTCSYKVTTTTIKSRTQHEEKQNS